MATTKTNKPRIHSVAKELGINNKELIEILEKYGMGTKNHMSTLLPADMDVIFDYYTIKFDDGSDVSEFLSPAEPQVEEKPAEEKKPKKKEKETKTEEAQQPAEIKKAKSRYVDTRSSNVDLDKLDKTEKIEEMLGEDGMKDNSAAGKQKIKKKKNRPNKGSHQAEIRKEPVELRDFVFAVPSVINVSVSYRGHVPAKTKHVHALWMVKRKVCC